ISTHPLMRWFAATGDPGPQTLARVPSAIAPSGDRAAFEHVLRSQGSERQLSIPYRMRGDEYREFLLVRSGRDFSDDDLQVSRLLQPIFAAVDVQAQVLADLLPGAGRGPQPDLVDLTGRELAVLRLLAEGLTAFSIARRLSSSPRTVNKHLEHIYRKLE